MIDIDKIKNTEGFKGRCHDKYIRYKNKNPKMMLLSPAKKRAKDKNLEFNIDIDDIKIPEFCPILNIKLCPFTGASGGTDVSPSLDRINPNKGYIKGNIQVISFRANNLKSNGKLSEFEALVKWMKDNNCP